MQGTAQVESQIVFRSLSGSKAAFALNPYIEARGWTPLNPSDNPVLVKAQVAFRHSPLTSSYGDPVGFFCLQMFPMLGPVCVIDGEDPRVFGELVGQMRRFLAESGVKGWLIIAENPRIAELCNGLGFKKIEFPVYLGK